MREIKEDTKCALVYCRVSTDEQAKHGYSLENQEQECRKFSLASGFAVDKVFIERGESAKTQERPQLKKLIKYAVEHKKNLSALVIWKLDRLARNLADQIELIKSFDKIGIRVLFVTDTNEDNSTGRLMRNILGAFNQYDNEIKGERTSKGMKQAVQEGRWCWKAPVGYKNTRDSMNKASLIPSEDAPFVVEAFRMAETSLYKQVHIAKELKKQGFKRATANLINRILRNTLYTALIRVPKWFPEDIEAIHKPLVARETFWKVQSIIDGKRPSITPRNRSNPDFPLRNFIRCPKCGQKLTAGWSTGRKGVRYPYYHCRTKGCSLNAKRKDLDSRFVEYLKSFQPNEDILLLFKDIVLDVWTRLKEERVKERHRLENDLLALHKERDRIEELKITNVFDDATYQRRSVEVMARIDQKQAELDDASSELGEDAEGCLDYCGYVISNISALWQEAGLDLKQRFQTLLFPDKVYYEGGGFRTAKTALIFNHLQQNQLQKSNMAAPRGFEPRSLE